MTGKGNGTREWLAVLVSLRRQVSMLTARAVGRLVNDRAAVSELLEILADELQKDVERAQDYGLTSHPLPGRDTIVLCGGVREQTVAVDHRRNRPTDLARREVALHTDEGDRIMLRRGRVMAVTARTRLRVDAPEAEFTVAVRIAGTLTVDGNAAFGAAV